MRVIIPHCCCRCDRIASIGAVAAQTRTRGGCVMMRRLRHRRLLRSETPRGGVHQRRIVHVPTLSPSRRGVRHHRFRVKRQRFHRRRWFLHRASGIVAHHSRPAVQRRRSPAFRHVSHVGRRNRRRKINILPLHVFQHNLQRLFRFTIRF